MKMNLPSLFLLQFFHFLGTPKFDIRDWDGEHVKMGKGITLTNEELAALKSTLEQMQV